MADISGEIAAFRSAKYGEDVRDSMISLAEKINTEAEAATAEVADNTQEVESFYVSIGTVVTVSSDSDAKVTVTGTSFQPVLNFEIPRGANGGAAGDISQNPVNFSDTATRANLVTGETLAEGFGKIKKWFTDLATGAFAAVANQLDINVDGYVLDARQGKVLNDRLDGLTDLFYPVGSYYETSDASFDPNISWGGTWTLESGGQVHVSAGGTYAAGDTGGAEDTTLVEANLPRITGSAKLASNIARNTTGASTLLESASGHFTRNSQSGQNVLTVSNVSVHQNQTLYTSMTYAFGQTNPDKISRMQPYIVVNRWHRTA